MVSVFLSLYLPEDFQHPNESLEYVCRVLEVEPEFTLLPSHERYLAYFGYVLCGFVPV